MKEGKSKITQLTSSDKKSSGYSDKVLPLKQVSSIPKKP
jgi:hypothetical protein